ncbi:MAG: hypothetical protein AB7O96_18255 [Pseudobdellovibrionaceae bacterium]
MASLLADFPSPEAAIEALRSQLTASPVDSRLNLQVFLNALGREEESYEISNQLIAIAPHDPRVLFNRGWHLLKRGKFSEGMALLENGRTLNTYGHPPLPSTRKIWDRSNGRGHRVHLVLEGGLGDQLIHLRFGQDLIDKYECHVTAICTPSLASLLTHQKWISAIAQREAALGIYHDSWLSGMSAAYALGYEYSDISGKPYLKSSPLKMEQWKSLLNSKKLKVGIRWAGNPQFEHQQLRRFPVELLTDLKQNTEVQLYSFQRDDGLIKLPEEIIDLGPHLKDWEDTAAAMEHMDLMISSCTSVAHASAALGKKTWVIVPALPYFIWALPGKRSPWYDWVTLFRQKTFGDWTNVREELHADFKNWIAGGRG